MNYWRELLQNWRPLLAATLGAGSGMSLAGMIDSTMAPQLIAGNHWDPADYTFVGTLGIFSSLVFPFIGRLADVIGVRWTALIGQVTLPIAYFAYSRMSGSLNEYIAIFVITSMICVTTTATVYSRLAVQYVAKARGLALAIVVSGGAIMSMIGGPVLNAYVKANGWREGYVALAICSIVAAIIVFLLMPPERKSGGAMPAKRHSAREDYPVIFGSTAFWILAVAMLLCNLPQTLALRQLSLLMQSNGVSETDVAWMLGSLPAGMLIGRLVSGLLIDRFNPHLIAFVMMAIPSLGLFVIASNMDGVAILTFAALSIGFAFGAEGDIVAFLVAKHFGVRIYSSVMGLMTAIISLATSGGALLLSQIMKAGGGYDGFLLLTGTTVIIGAASLLLLGNVPVLTGQVEGEEKAA